MDNYTFTPEKAIIFYRTGHNGMYAEVSSLIPQGDGFVPSESRPLRARDIEEIAKIGKETSGRDGCGYIPEHILSLEPLVWYRKAGKEKLYFSKKLNIPDTEYSLPALVFKLQGGKLSVFAMKKNTRPNPDTLLYYVPFLNCYENGSMCLGSTTIKKGNTLADTARNAEKAFFLSEFSHTIAFTGNGNLYTFWKNLGESGEKFPIKKLIGDGIELKRIMGG